MIFHSTGLKMAFVPHCISFRREIESMAFTVRTEIWYPAFSIKHDLTTRSSSLEVVTGKKIKSIKIQGYFFTHMFCMTRGRLALQDLVGLHDLYFHEFLMYSSPSAGLCANHDTHKLLKALKDVNILYTLSILIAIQSVQQ